MIRQDIENILTEFKPIHLENMDRVSLLNRKDTKYVFHIDELSSALNYFSKYYYVLEIEKKHYTPYLSTYFDSPDMEFYMRHHNERVNRYKVRYRKYLNSNVVFFEIKHKNNKGWTKKMRFQQKEIKSIIDADTAAFITRNTSIPADKLQSKLDVHYSRVTLVSYDMDERLTLDLNLKYALGENEKSFNSLVILENKINGNKISEAMKYLKNVHIREENFSKYCMGIACMYDTIKKNNFKPKLTYLNNYVS